MEVPPCRMTRSGLEGYVNRSDVPYERVLTSLQYNVPLDCMWVITVDHGWKVAGSNSHRPNRIRLICSLCYLLKPISLYYKTLFG